MIRVYEMEPWVTQNTCRDKRRYDSPGLAEKKRMEHVTRGEYNIVIYRCEWCHGYHLGKRHQNTRR